MITSPIVAASLLAAAPRRGRLVGEPKDRPAYPRSVKIVAPRPSTRIQPINDLYHRAAAARLRIRGLRERQARAGIVWNDQKAAQG